MGGFVAYSFLDESLASKSKHLLPGEFIFTQGQQLGLLGHVQDTPISTSNVNMPDIMVPQQSDAKLASSRQQSNLPQLPQLPQLEEQEQVQTQTQTQQPPMIRTPDNMTVVVTNATSEQAEQKLAIKSRSPRSPGSPRLPISPRIREIHLCKIILDIPKEVWMISYLAFAQNAGITSVSSFITYYMLDNYSENVTALEIGYFLVVVGVSYLFSAILLFNKLNGYFENIYISSMFGFFMYGTFQILFVLTFDINIWLALGLLVTACGIGNGLSFPVVPTMGSDFCNNENRGVILALAAVFGHFGLIAGPIVFGWLYDINNHSIFYLSSLLFYINIIGVAWLLLHDDRKLLKRLNSLKKKKNKNKHNRETSRSRSRSKSSKKGGNSSVPIIDDEQNLGNDLEQQEAKSGVTTLAPPRALTASIEEKQKWYADEPNDDDYRQLGRDFGRILLQKNHNWVTYYNQLIPYLTELFPTARTTCVEDNEDDIPYVISREKQALFLQASSHMFQRSVRL